MGVGGDFHFSVKPLQISTSLSDENFSLVLQCLTQCMVFVQCVVDPRRKWQKEFMR